MYKSTKDIIKSRISRGGRGRILFLQDMDDVAEHESVKKAFQRLTQEGMLVRITKGIYWYPKYDEELGLLHASFYRFLGDRFLCVDCQR